MSKILDKIAPEIKLYKYLGTELKELKKVCDDYFIVKADPEWQLKSIDELYDIFLARVAELKIAMDITWQDAMVHEALISRMEQLLLEWRECALAALQGADRTRRNIELLRERIKDKERQPIDVSENIEISEVSEDALQPTEKEETK